MINAQGKQQAWYLLEEIPKVGLQKCVTFCKFSDSDEKKIVWNHTKNVNTGYVYVGLEQWFNGASECLKCVFYLCLVKVCPFTSCFQQNEIIHWYDVRKKRNYTLVKTNFALYSNYSLACPVHWKNVSIFKTVL